MTDSGGEYSGFSESQIAYDILRERGEAKVALVQKHCNTDKPLDKP